MFSGQKPSEYFEVHPTAKWLSPALLAGYMLFTNVLLLNLLIAIFRYFRFSTCFFTILEPQDGFSCDENLGKAKTLIPVTLVGVLSCCVCLSYHI